MRIILNYADLRGYIHKGMRTGNWRKLNFLDQSLFRTAMMYLKHHGSIVNEMLVKKLLGLIEMLKETKGMRIFRRGFKKAVAMLEKGEEKGVFVWAPSLRHWLKDSDYVFWLGTMR